MASCASDWCAVQFPWVTLFVWRAPALKRSPPHQTASHSWRVSHLCRLCHLSRLCRGFFPRALRKVWGFLSTGKNASTFHHVFTPATRTPAGRGRRYIVSLVVSTALRLISLTSRLLLSAPAPVSTSRALVRRRVDGEILVLRWPFGQAPEGSVHDARSSRRVPRAVRVEDVPRVPRWVLEAHRGLLRQASPPGPACVRGGLGETRARGGESSPSGTRGDGK